MAISASFVNRGHQVWQRHPGHSPAWVWASLALLASAGLYSGLSALVMDCSSEQEEQEEVECPSPAVAVWAIWAVGIPFVLAFNELVKRHEIRQVMAAQFSR